MMVTAAVEHSNLRRFAIARDLRPGREDSVAKRSSKSKKQKSKPKTSPKRVAMRASASQEEDHIDGCDVEFGDHEATPDSALPVARGGVERVRAGRRG